MCVPSGVTTNNNNNNNNIGSRDLPQACGMSYGGRGTALSVRAAVVALRLGDSGELSASGGARSVDVLDADVAAIVQANVLRGATESQGIESRADASIADVHVGVAGHVISAAILQSDAHASCSNAYGGSLIANLQIDNLDVEVTGQPNQTIAVGPVRIVINEQIKSTGAIVVNALHISAANLADVAIATSLASVVCPCGSNSVPTDGNNAGGTGAGAGTGTGNGSSSSTSSSSSSSTSSSSSSSGGGGGEGSSGGGTSSSSSSSSSSSGGGGDGTATPASNRPDFGQLGDACDDTNVCAPGNQCDAVDASPVH